MKIVSRAKLKLENFIGMKLRKSLQKVFKIVPLLAVSSLVTNRKFFFLATRDLLYNVEEFHF